MFELPSPTALAEILKQAAYDLHINLKHSEVLALAEYTISELQYRSQARPPAAEYTSKEVEELANNGLWNE